MGVIVRPNELVERRVLEGFLVETIRHLLQIFQRDLFHQGLRPFRYNMSTSSATHAKRNETIWFGRFLLAGIQPRCRGLAGIIHIGFLRQLGVVQAQIAGFAFQIVRRRRHGFCSFFLVIQIM